MSVHLALFSVACFASLHVIFYLSPYLAQQWQLVFRRPAVGKEYDYDNWSTGCGKKWCLASAGYDNLKIAFCYFLKTA